MKSKEMKSKKINSCFKEKYGPYALVAGGSNGLGAAFAEALAQRGLNLVLMAREKERLEATANSLKTQYSVDVITFAVDLADFEKIKSLIASLKVSTQKVSIPEISIPEISIPEVSIGLLVYNAAFAPIGLFENTSEEQLSLAAAVNVRSPLLLAKLLSTQMIQNNRGGIVLMSSLAGAQGSPRLAAYAATKAFNSILAEGLWKELRPHGVDVIGCCAGAILTPGYQQAARSAGTDQRSGEGSPPAKSKAAPGTMTAHDVAERTLNALGKGPVVIPGNVNKIGRFVLTRLLTRKAAIGIMSKNTGGLS